MWLPARRLFGARRRDNVAEKRGDEVGRGDETAAAASDADGLFLAPILFIKAFPQLKQRPPPVTKIRPTRAISLQLLGPMAAQPS